jgi:hypothetical protein
MLNDDGAPDSLVRDGSVMRLYTGNGPGGWSSVRTLEVTAGAYDWLIGVGRIGTNRQPDFSARGKATGRLYLLPGTVNGWSAKVSLGKYAGGYNLAA